MIHVYKLNRQIFYFDSNKTGAQCLFDRSSHKMLFSSAKTAIKDLKTAFPASKITPRNFPGDQKL